MISIIIPAYNEEDLLGATIDAAHDAAGALGEPYEIVVSDDASTDRTAKVAGAHGARVVATSNRQIAATRNAGARASRGEMLIFVDADTIVSEPAVRDAVKAMRSGAVGGGGTVRFDGRLPMYARVLEPLALLVMRMARIAPGCFLFCTRQAFDAVGGFDETCFAAEEAVMSMALRRTGRMVFLRASVTTSGRKLRTHSPWEILGVIGRFLFIGTRYLQRRDGLDIWYGSRREDPGS